jgi:DNA-binding protein HU-beta
MRRPDAIPDLEVSTETKRLLAEILSMGDAPSDELLTKVVPDPSAFAEFLSEYGLRDYGPAKQLLLQLGAVAARKQFSSAPRTAKSSKYALTKAGLIRQMAEKLTLSRLQTAGILDLLAETALKETKQNGVFVIPGIGRLIKAERKARVGRNPQTGEPIKIRAKTVVAMRIAKKAAQALSEGKKKRPAE